jgi:hypothetical protein
MARLPGMVQGVVVQITIAAPSRTATGLDTTGKRTVIVGLVWS